MKRTGLMGSTAACLCLGLVSAAFAAPPATSSTPGHTATVQPTPAIAQSAVVCLADLRAFAGQMREGGYWLDGSDYGYGYPVGGYGYGGSYPMGNTPAGSDVGYFSRRPGYEVRNLLASANILAQNGQQQSCEDVLAATRTLYTRYAGELTDRGVSRRDDPKWRQQQIATVQPVTDKTALESAQLLDTEVRSPQDEPLGSVRDLVISPKTGKLAYVIVARGGLFGIDQSYVPVPWEDFKVNGSASLLVLDSTKAAMSAAPDVTDAQLTAKGHFDAESSKVDAYWKTKLAAKATN